MPYESTLNISTNESFIDSSRILQTNASEPPATAADTDTHINNYSFNISSVSNNQREQLQPSIASAHNSGVLTRARSILQQRQDQDSTLH